MKKKVVLQKLRLNKEKIMPLTNVEAEFVLGGGGSVIRTQVPKPPPPTETKDSCGNCISGYDGCIGGE